MTVLELSFPAGRYHATPWGRRVNEGAVEWPPSPWRIIRALIATWHLKAREIPEESVRSLMNALSQPPAFRLPRASAGHTRHYMPLGNKKPTKVFDTFIQLEEGSTIFVAWEVSLDDDEHAALTTLAERLGYFGRSESLAVARVLDGITGIEANAVPCCASLPSIRMARMPSSSNSTNGAVRSASAARVCAHSSSRPAVTVAEAAVATAPAVPLPSRSPNPSPARSRWATVLTSASACLYPPESESVGSVPSVTGRLSWNVCRRSRREFAHRVTAGSRAQRNEGRSHLRRNVRR
ncbi:MAG: type I-U CRISPR-associated protein Cas5/Cas6 [Verrucomicrobiae bacterium]|nr:type I-U CRISPR-associated protein Cas5/Cas6 [Verrucomicrobiae bacterium]